MNEFVVFHSTTSVILRVKLDVPSLTEASAGLVISTITDNEASVTRYRASSSEIETISTLGTYAAPSSGKCRFKEVDATNMPRVYELHLDDARFAVSGASRLRICFTGAGISAVGIDATVELPPAAINAGQYLHIDHSATSVIVPIILPSTNITNSSAGLVVSFKPDNTASAYRFRADSGEIEAGSTGVYSAPSSGKCRIIKTGANSPGRYELNFEDARFAESGAKDITVDVHGGGLPPFGAKLFINLRPLKVASVTGNVGGNVLGTVATVTTLTNLPAITNNWLTAAGIADGAFTAAKFAASSLNGKGDWLLSSSYTAPLTAATTRAALGMASANLDTQLAAIQSAITTLGLVATLTNNVTEDGTMLVTEGTTYGSGMATAHPFVVSKDYSGYDSVTCEIWRENDDGTPTTAATATLLKSIPATVNSSTSISLSWTATFLAAIRYSGNPAFELVRYHLYATEGSNDETIQKGFVYVSRGSAA